METTHKYTVKLNWQNDRKGIVHSPVLDTQIEVAKTPEFTGGMPGIWSPEHLLVTAVNSCLMTTFLAIAENSKLSFVHFDSDAEGKLERVENKYMLTEIVLNPVLTIANEADRERATRILDKSEAACLISNSIKSKIIFQPQIKIAEKISI